MELVHGVTFSNISSFNLSGIYNNVVHMRLDQRCCHSGFNISSIKRRIVKANFKAGDTTFTGRQERVTLLYFIVIISFHDKDTEKVFNR